MIERRLLDRLWNVGGVEHDVFHDPESGRWIKFTLPARGGKMIVAKSQGAGLPPQLATEDAPPFSYLRRLTLANSRLGDDFWLHGIIDDPAGPRMVVSQRDIGGDPAEREVIARHFGRHGFRTINERTFYHPSANLLVSDAHPANVFVAAQDVVAFDVGVQRPAGELRDAVSQRPALDFGDLRDQAQLDLKR